MAIALRVRKDAVAVEDERGHHALPSPPNMPDVVLGHLEDGGPLGDEELGRVVFARVLGHVVVARLDERDLQRGRDVDLRAAPRDQVTELLGRHAGAAVERDRDAGRLDDVGHSLVVEFRRRLVHAVGVADRRGVDVDLVERMKSSAVVERLLVGPFVVGHVLDALERLDLSLDERAP